MSPGARLHKTWALVLLVYALLSWRVYWSARNVVFAAVDDMNSSLTRSLVDSWTVAMYWARAAGRPYPVSAIAGFEAYAVDSYTWMRASASISMALNGLLFLVLLAKLSRSLALGALAGFTWLALQQNLGVYHLFACYPVGFTLPFSLLLCSFLLLAASSTRNDPRLLLAAAFLYLLACFAYESFSLYIVVVPAIVVLAVRADRPTRRTLLVRSLAAYLTVFIGYSLTYWYLRRHATNVYDGATLASSIDWSRIVRTWHVLSSGSLPFSIFRSDDGSRVFSGIGPGSLLFESLAYAFTEPAAFAFLLAVPVLVFLDREERGSADGPRPATLLLLAGLLYAIPNLLYSITPKYQHYVIDLGGTQYVGTYFAAFGASLFMPLLFALVSRKLHHGIRRTALAVAVAAVVAFVGVVHDFGNTRMGRAQQRDARPWLVAKALRTPAVAATIASSDLIVAPAMFRTFHRPFDLGEDYWRAWTAKYLGRPLSIHASWPDAYREDAAHQPPSRVLLLRLPEDTEAIREIEITSVDPGRDVNAKQPVCASLREVVTLAEPPKVAEESGDCLPIQLQ